MNLLYFINKSLSGMKNAGLVNLLAVVNISMSMTLFGGFLVGIINVNSFVESMGERLEVVAYLSDGISDESLKKLEEEIRKYPEVRGIAYISKEDALASLDKGLSGEPSVLEGLDENPLPASLIIKLNDVHQNLAGLKVVAERLDKIDSIEDLQYGGEWTERFSLLISMLKFAGVAFGVVIIISTMFIVSNTIRLTIHTRRDEIEVMRLVGATPLFIKAPFYIEGIVLGGIGAVFAVGILFAANRFIEYNFGNDLRLLFGGTLDIFPYQAVAGILFFGTASGFIGSVLSLWRFSRN